MAYLSSSILFSSNSLIVYIPSDIYSPTASQVLGPLLESSSMLLFKSIPSYVGIGQERERRQVLDQLTFFFKILGTRLFFGPITNLVQCTIHIFFKIGEGDLRVTHSNPNFVQGTPLCYSFCLKNRFLLSYEYYEHSLFWALQGPESIRGYQNHSGSLYFSLLNIRSGFVRYKRM